MIKHLRNVQNVIPLGISIPSARRHGEEFAAGIGFKPGDDLMAVFKKLGGTYEYVVSVLGRYSDSVLLMNDGTFVAEHDACETYNIERFNEFIAEAIGHRVLHHPYLVKAHIPGAHVAVPRFIGDDESMRAARGEAIGFSLGFLLPRARIEEAFAAGKSDAEIAAQFVVTHRLIRGQRESRSKRLALQAAAAKPEAVDA